MKSPNLGCVRFLLLASLSFLVSTPLFAQNIWLDQGEDNSVGVEFLKPRFSGEVDSDFFTSALFLSGRVRIVDKLIFVAELPIARRGFDDDFGLLESATVIGNPYLGFETRGDVFRRIRIAAVFSFPRRF